MKVQLESGAEYQLEWDDSAVKVTVGKSHIWIEKDLLPHIEEMYKKYKD